MSEEASHRVPTLPDVGSLVASSAGEVRQKAVPPRLTTPQVMPTPAAIPPVVKANMPAQPNQQAVTTPRLLRYLAIPKRLVQVVWNAASVIVLLAIIAAIPVVQFVSLGYLLVSASHLASGRPWRTCLPGSHVAGRLTTFLALAFLLWLPVWLVTDLAYDAQLVQPNSSAALGWRLAAFAVSGAWVAYLTWTALRGGRWWHFLWPSPLRFLKTIWRPSTWRNANNRLYDWVSGLQLPRLWWIGAQAVVGALAWTCVPVSMMIIGLRGRADIVGLVGLVGAIAMSIVMLYLPFLQIRLAQTGRFRELFNVRHIRRQFLYAPLAHAFSLLALCVLCLPLYLLRIEATPSELLWAPSLVFVAFMMPAKWLLGAAMGYAGRRQKMESVLQAELRESSVTESKRMNYRRHFTLRWTSRFVAIASVLVYVGAMYVAQLVAGQGIYVMYFQHAFLVPAPLISA